jgi:hypothetical protein
MNKYVSVWLLASAFSGALASCGDAGVVTKKKWSASIAAPAKFEFWRGSGQLIDLPAPRERFLSVVSAAGGQYYMKGEGSEFPSAPRPWQGSPCKETKRVIVVVFPIDNGVGPYYVAYVNDADLVECVEKQFAYAAP